jgi:hypothetical protein
MAVYNEILVGRFARMLQKFFAIKGSVPAKQLSGEIFPSFPLFNGVENRHLEGWQRFSMQTTQAAGAAGTAAFCLLRNPVGSGIMAILEKLVAVNISAAADGLNLFYGAALAGADGGTVYTPQIMDPRAGAQTGSAMKLTSGTIAGGQVIGTQVDGVLADVNDWYDFILTEDAELGPIMPGNGVQVQTSLFVLGLSVSWRWRQRPIEESEAT